MTNQADDSPEKIEILEYFSSTLRIPADKIVTDIHILELGVDSIMLVEAQRWLFSRFGCRIEVHQFFEELNTIDKIAAFVSSRGFETDIAAQASTEKGRPDPAPRRANTLPKPLSAESAMTELGLMRSQLALIGEVIEAQNRLLIAANREKARTNGQ